MSQQESVKSNTCWLDGGECPYGMPYGKFEDRPRADCHLEEGGCSKLRQSAGLNRFMDPVVEKERSAEYKRIEKGLDDRREPTSEYLENQAIVLSEEKVISKDDKELILAAAKVFKKFSRVVTVDCFVVTMSDNDLYDL